MSEKEKEIIETFMNVLPKMTEVERKAAFIRTGHDFHERRAGEAENGSRIERRKL